MIPFPPSCITMAREMAYLTPGHPHHQWSMGHVPSVAFGLMKTIIIHCPVPRVFTFPLPTAYPSSISRGPHEDPRFDEAITIHFHQLLHGFGMMTVCVD